VPRNVSFIILAAAISGMPTPEIRFLPGQLRWMLLHKKHYGDSKHPAFHLRGGHSSTVLTPPQRSLCRQCLGVTWCLDVPLGHYWRTNHKKKRI